MISPAFSTITRSPTVLARDFVFVVKRGSGDGRSRDLDGFEFRDGRDFSRASDLERDGEQRRLRLFGRVFEGDGPARRVGLFSEPALQGEFVELDDGAVRRKIEVSAQFSEFTDFFGRSVPAEHFSAEVREGKSPGAERVAQFGERGEGAFGFARA